MRTSDLGYELPEELIAQRPLEERDAARMCVVDRARGEVRHSLVRALATELPPSLIVVNDTRVIPARLFGEKASGGKVELLLVERLSPPGRKEDHPGGIRAEGAGGPRVTTVETWLALGRASKGLRPGMEVSLGGGEIVARVTERRDGGEVVVELASDRAIDEALSAVGTVPLPPYIRRSADDADRERYQTVFAERPGAVAAPTAGLHLTGRLLAELEEAGHVVARVTLHVGPGTFAPVKTERLEDHPMHAERYEVPEATSRAIAAARAEGRGVLAVGTTVVRTLEAAANQDGTVRAGAGQTSLFIRPPYQFRAIDALLTNFHLPRSTLLALVMAFGGVDLVRRAYDEAIRERYRFFSYGDAMLIR